MPSGRNKDYMMWWGVRSPPPRKLFEIYTEKLPSEQKKLQPHSYDEKKLQPHLPNSPNRLHYFLWCQWSQSNEPNDPSHLLSLAHFKLLRASDHMHSAAMKWPCNSINVKTWPVTLRIKECLYRLWYAHILGPVVSAVEQKASLPQVEYLRPHKDHWYGFNLLPGGCNKVIN